MSNEIREIESTGNKQPSKLLMLAVLLLSIAAVAAPILIVRTTLYDEDGISKNALLTHLLLPGVWSAVILLVIVLIVRTRVAGELDVVWYRWTRPEVTLAILFVLIITAGYPLLGMLLHKLGLPPSSNLMFWADRRGLAFYVILTILSAVFGPVLEELFWRGYVQRTLERIFGGLAACLVQAVPFAAYHFMPLGGFLQVFFFGLAMGAWRWRRRTLLPIILTHIAVNSLFCLARWPYWLDCTRIKATTDYVAEFIELSKPVGYDPNDDARQEYAKAGQLVVKLPEELKEVRERYPTQWSQEEQARAEAWLISNEKALDLVGKGAQKACYWVEYERQNERMPASMKNLDKMKDFVFGLCMRATLRTAEGRYDEGLDDIKTCYRLGRHLAANKDMICCLAGYAGRSSALQATRIILAHEKINGQLLNRLQSQFEKFAEDDTYGFDFTAERLIAMDFIQCVFTDGGQGGVYIPRSFLKQRRLPGGKYETGIPFLSIETESDANRWRKLQRRRTTEQVEWYYSLCETVCSQPPWRYRVISFMRMSIEMLQKQNPLIELCSPAIDRLVRKAGRVPVDRDATITILAILHYKDDKKQLPDTLSELVNTDYLEAVPEDVFYNGPLIYRRSGDDFILYSFGADFDDDGGTPSKWGEGEKGGDQVFWPVQESNDYSEALTESELSHFLGAVF